LSAAIDVIVDPDNDIATVRAIHGLAASEPTVLAVAIGPDCRTPPEVVWAILRALGKRSEHLAGASPGWPDATRWLTAHDILELVVLGAQRLTPPVLRDLLRVAHSADLRLTLVHNDSGHADKAHHVAITLEQLLSRPRATRRSPARARAWPSVPRSPALRLRFDCLHALPRDEFAVVDRLLSATFSAADAWLSANHNAAPHWLSRVVAVMTTAPDAGQRHIRRCAVTSALLLHGMANPPKESDEQAARTVSPVDVERALAHTDAVAGTYRLAAAITGLEPELLALLASDQITHDTIAGYAVPQRCAPVLLALGDRDGPIFHRAASKVPRPTVRGLDRRRPAMGSTTTEVQALVAVVLGQLMFGRARRVSKTTLPANVQTELDALVAAGILDAYRGTYRASHVALYSCYQLPCAPARSTDNQMGGITDIAWEPR
jgi:hypothetical protein